VLIEPNGVFDKEQVGFTQPSRRVWPDGKNACAACPGGVPAWAVQLVVDPYDQSFWFRGRQPLHDIVLPPTFVGLRPGGRGVRECT